MKRLTYTQMRSELSDILELLRAGQSITVTQKGKPDIILQGICGDDNSCLNSDLEELPPLINPTSLEKKFLNNGLSKRLSEMTEVMEKIAKLPNLFDSSTMKETLAIAGNITTKIHEVSEKCRFNKALSYTQKKHAKILKKLEDK